MKTPALPILISLFAISIGSFGHAGGSSGAGSSDEVRLERGVYRPFFRERGEEDRSIGPLRIDKDPVTNAKFARFVRANPEWRRSKIPELFGSKTYLAHWTSDTSFDSRAAQQPVTNVTWYAARAYCEWRGQRLLTVDEWEFASDGQDPANLELILGWYGRSNQLDDVKKAKVNARGLRGMHGLVWEWVEDFSSVIVAGDSRDSNETSAKMFCGAGALQAKDPAQYATFMRYAHRSSLQANYTGKALGFRCGS